MQLILFRFIGAIDLTSQLVSFVDVQSARKEKFITAFGERDS